MRPPDRPRVIRNSGAEPPADAASDSAAGSAAGARAGGRRGAGRRDLDPPDRRDLPDPGWDLPPPPSPPGGSGFRQSHRRSMLEMVGVAVGFVLAVVGIFKLAAWLAVRALPLIPVSLDQSVGEVAYDQAAGKDRMCTDPGPQAYVDALVRPLVEAAKAPFPFTFRVLDDDTANAFALPGGFVAVHFGLLTEAETGAEVAAVLAHELAHATERHGLARILRKVGGWVALGAVLGWADLGTLTGVAGELLDSGYDRDQERDADRVGRDLMRAAQIDPRAMGDFFDRLAAKEGLPAFTRLIATHPPSAERAAEARAAAPLAGAARDLPPPKGLRCHPEGGKRP